MPVAKPVIRAKPKVRALGVTIDLFLICVDNSLSVIG